MTIGAIVVLQGGKDSMDRVNKAIELFHMGFKVPMILTGNNSPRIEELKGWYLGPLAEQILNATGERLYGGL